MAMTAAGWSGSECEFAPSIMEGCYLLPYVKHRLLHFTHSVKYVNVSDPTIISIFVFGWWDSQDSFRGRYPTL